MNLHFFDLIVLIIVGFFAFKGLSHGLIEELFKLVGIIVAIIFAVKLMTPGAYLLAEIVNAEPEKLGFVSFLIIFILIMIGFRVAAKILKGIFKFAMLGWLDKAGGGAFGAAKGALLISALIWLLLFLPVQSYTNDLRDNSMTFGFLENFAPKVYDGMMRVIPGSVTFQEKIDGFISQGLSLKAADFFRNPKFLNDLQDEIGYDETSNLLKLINPEQPGGASIEEAVKELPEEEQEKVKYLIRVYEKKTGSDSTGN